MNWYWWLPALAVAAVMVWLLLFWARPKQEVVEVDADSETGDVDHDDDAQAPSGQQPHNAEIRDAPAEQPTLWEDGQGGPAVAAPRARADDDSALWDAPRSSTESADATDSTDSTIRS